VGNLRIHMKQAADAAAGPAPAAASPTA
jgi:hypothetical protein